MRRVTLVKVLNERQSVYNCEPAYDGNQFVVISIALAFAGRETYAFASDSEGVITDWTELDCSERGVTDHKPIIHNIEQTP